MIHVNVECNNCGSSLNTNVRYDYGDITISVETCKPCVAEAAQA